jgi:hypothetical protein
MALHLANERRNLGKIGTGAYDVDNFQRSAHGMFETLANESIAFEFMQFGGRKLPFASKKH